jgi:hypothetical protein
MNKAYDFEKDLSLRKKELLERALQNSNWPKELYPFFPTGIIKILENQALRRVECESENDLSGDPDRQDRFLEYLWEAICNYQEVVLGFQSPYPQGVIPRMKATTKKQPVKKWSDWNRRLFERRLDVVKFVVENWALSNSAQMKWQQLTSKWNEVYPLDPLNPIQMKTLYNRGIRDKGLMVQLLAAEGSKMIDQGQRIYQKLRKPFIPVSEWDSKSKEPLLLRLYKHSVLVDLFSQGYDVNKKAGFEVATGD